MKKLLCYIAIIILLALIITPPLLRKFYKSPDEGNVVEDKYEILSCTKNNYTISSSYKNSEPLNIKFTHLKEDEKLLNETKDNTLEYNLDKILKLDTNTKIEEETIKLEESDVLQISYFLIYEKASEESLSNIDYYNANINEQKNNYTTKGYTCNVIEA